MEQGTEQQQTTANTIVGTLLAVGLVVLLVWVGISVAGANNDLECSVGNAERVVAGGSGRDC